jgi:hypothetical protein
MRNERCPVAHPTLGIRCNRRAHDCWGIDHTARNKNGGMEFWSNDHETTPVHEYFRLWVMGKQAMAEKREQKDFAEEFKNL